MRWRMSGALGIAMPDICSSIVLLQPLPASTICFHTGQIVGPRGNLTGGESEFQARLKSDHARRVVASQADAQQARGRRDRVGQRAEPGLGGWLSRNACKHHARKAEIRVVEGIKELSLQAKLCALG